MEMKLDEIIGMIKERAIFPSVKRFEYLPYNMDLALNVVSEIGKTRNKKFVIDDENKFVYENLIRWVHADSKMQCLDPETKKITSGRIDAGIYIGGNTGSGKSWVLEIMSAYCLIDNVQIQLGDNKRCLYWGNARADVICDEYTSAGTFEKYKNMSILGIQDLGSEPHESLFMGNRISVIRQLIEHRGDFTDKITLISSNLPMNHKALTERYGDRVSSRLNEMCNYFELKGKDRRKN